MQNSAHTARYLLQELRESLRRMFLLAVAGIIVCLVLDNVNDIPLIWQKDIQDVSVLYYLYDSVNMGFYGMFVIPLMAALPYGLGYYRDEHAGITRTVISKTGIKTYCTGKALTAFVSGFLSCVCGIGIFSVFISGFKPWGTQNLAVEYEGMPFDRWVMDGRYIEYFLIRVFLLGIWCGICGLAALCISSYVKNASVVVASVTVVLFGWNMVNNILEISVAYRPASWFSGSYGLGQDRKTLAACLLFTVFSISALVTVFYKRVKKNLYTG